MDAPFTFSLKLNASMLFAEFSKSFDVSGAVKSAHISPSAVKSFVTAVRPVCAIRERKPLS